MAGFRDPVTGTFEAFIKHLEIVMPAIRELEARGMSDAQIARFFEFLADWLKHKGKEDGID